MQDIAIIGGGVAGMGAAWALSARHRVTLYESEARLGGHADTVEMEDGQGVVPVDMGFIVYNERNYPNLVRLFRHVGVRTEPSDMSFGVSLDGGRFEYQARALGLLAQPSNLVRPDFRHMLSDLVCFNLEARRPVDPALSTGAFLDEGRYSQSFQRELLLPMVACIWSSSLEAMRDFPAWAMIRFLDNHGLLDLGRRPKWRTVAGGSRTYVRRLTQPFADRVRLATPVSAILRGPDDVRVVDARGGIDTFDHVVLATHADRSLSILGSDASPEETQTLEAFRYRANRTILHRDPALMPRRRRAWSSWNYVAERHGAQDAPVSISYWMNRLQNLRTIRPAIVSLNPSREPRHVVAERVYHHPQYDAGAIEAQGRLGLIQGVRRTWFCGSYAGWGFHEDALRSGLQVADALGAPAPWWGIRPERSVPAPAGAPA